MEEDTIGDNDEEADTFFKDDLGIAINDNDDVEEDFISNDDLVTRRKDKFVNTNLVSFIKASTPFWDIILSETERFISLSRQFQAPCFFSSFMSGHGRHMLTRAISPAPAARTVSTKNLSIIDTIPVYADGQEATEAKIVQLQF